jgi:hypothetical protein
VKENLMAERPWYLAESLAALRTEINRRWPNRDKDSDGAKGDPAHAARQSDHNPDYDRSGIVRAIDVDKDGINVTQLLAAVIRDPRVAYVIWNRRIASATDDGTPWDWEPYDGENPHDKHIHISIKHTRAAETNTATWFKAATPQGDDMPSAKEVAQEVFNLLEPRLQAYTQDLKTFERQTDGPDALRAGQAAEAEILTPENIDRIATAVAAKIAKATTPKA